jgi:regulator of protease activity HflC (stomatin/prohibitin superfamily)
MADVTRRFFLRHLRGAPTSWVRHHVKGKVRHEGIGQSFWYRPLTAVLSEVPVDDRELPLLFHARTSDFADVTVQATVTYRISTPATAAERLDFSVDPLLGQWRGQPLDQVATLLAELAQQPALDLLVRLPLTEALTAGIVPVREAVSVALSGDPRLTDTGVSVVSARVVAIRPEPDLERALQTPTRESIQQEADRATYARRARAVEQERAIAENEMQSKIELARASSSWSSSTAPTRSARPSSTPRPRWSRRRRRASGRGSPRSPRPRPTGSAPRPGRAGSGRSGSRRARPRRRSWPHTATCRPRSCRPSRCASSRVSCRRSVRSR